MSRSVSDVAVCVAWTHLTGRVELYEIVVIDLLEVLVVVPHRDVLTGRVNAMTTFAAAGSPAPTWIVPAHGQVLTDRHREHGYRVTDDGRICGTPRAANDPRFDRSFVPVDAFAPNVDAAWGVLHRLSWFTLSDALALRNGRSSLAWHREVAMRLAPGWKTPMADLS